MEQTNRHACQRKKKKEESSIRNINGDEPHAASGEDGANKEERNHTDTHTHTQAGPLLAACVSV